MNNYACAMVKHKEGEPTVGIQNCFIMNITKTRGNYKMELMFVNGSFLTVLVSTKVFSLYFLPKLINLKFRNEANIPKVCTELIVNIHKEAREDISLKPLIR